MVIRIACFAIFRAILGCSSQPAGQEAYLRLSYEDFNAMGTSWRALESRGEYRAAARLLETYISRHSEVRPEEELTLVHFHTAQMLAFVGDTSPAIVHLRHAKFKVEPSSWPMRWNDYVTATEAFLEHDRESLVAARERIAAGPKWNGEAPSLNVVDSLIEHFGEPYFVAYTKAKRSPNQAAQSTTTAVTPPAEQPSRQP